MENVTTYVAMGIVTDQDGKVNPPNSRYFTDRNQAERQYHLYCASAATSESAVYTAILMTTEGFILETKTWKHESPTPEPEPEPETVEGE